MKINNFIELMNNDKNKMLKSEQLQQLISKTLEVKKYIGIKEKKILIDNIVNSCIIHEDGIFKFNEIDKYISFTMMTIEAYTNLELSFDIENDYDELCNAKLLNAIVDTLAGEYENVKLLLAMQCDYILSSNNIEAQIGRALSSVLDKIDLFTNNLSTKLDSFNLDNLSVDMKDLNKIMEFVNSQK